MSDWPEAVASECSDVICVAVVTRWRLAGLASMPWLVAVQLLFFLAGKGQ